ncbi:alpha/beta hydrolase [soil metagenome]
MANPTVQKLVLKGLMALPAPLLRALSGGEPVSMGGRTLDPQFQLMAWAARKQGPISAATPAQVRTASAAGFALAQGALEPGTICENLTVPTPDGDLPARSYRPARQDEKAPLMVWLHQGGGVIGDLDTGHAFCSILAAATRGPVLSIDYRLAPEHRFPAAVNDALTAFRWGRDHADRFGAPGGSAALGGDSMGGHLTAVVTQALRAAGEAQPTVQLLCYPAVEADSRTQSMTTYADAYPLSKATMDWFMGHYVDPATTAADDVRLSPLHAPDLKGLAPAIVVTAGFDPLTDQG